MSEQVSGVPIVKLPQGISPGGMGMGGQGLPIGATVADRVGNAIDAKHNSKDIVLIEKHAQWMNPMERGAYAVLRATVGMAEDMAWMENPKIVEKAYVEAARLEKLGEKAQGWTVANKFMMMNCKLALAKGLYGRFLDHYVNASMGLNSSAHEDIVEMAKAFGANESNGNILSKLGSVFSRGGK